MRKGICLILSLLLCFSVCTVSLAEPAIIAHGSCGEKAFWKLDENGKLLIYGEGVINSDRTTPWENYKSRIISVEVREGITEFLCGYGGKGAFESCDNLITVQLPTTLIEIDNSMFENCFDLKQIVIPEGVTKINRNAFSACYELVDVTLPSTLTFIDHNAFAHCGKLKTITIPENVTTLGNDVFMSCFLLKTAYFLGDTPKKDYFNDYFLRDVFEPIANTIVYYRPEKKGWRTPVWGDWTCYPICERGHMDESGNLLIEEMIDSWTECVKLDDSYHHTTISYKFVCSDCHATVTIPIEFDEKHNFVNDVCEMCDYAGRHNSLETLTDVDYLAFSSLAYKDAEERNVTVYEMLAEEWNSNWDGTNIKVSELYSYIQDWVLVAYQDIYDTGFYAMAFQNDRNEVIIAYRGSIPLGPEWIDFADVLKDWALNDLTPILWDINPIHSQFQNAVDFYNARAFGRKPEQIAVTGHSLGGGLTDVVSGYSGSKGVGFNGIAILDINYFYHPEEMSISFVGIDKWNFVDHANEFDAFAGMWEVSYKNAFIHQSIDQSLKGKEPPDLLAYIVNAPKTHGMNTIVYKNENGEVKLTNGFASQVNFSLRDLGDIHGAETTLNGENVVDIIPGNKRALFLGKASKDIFRAEVKAKYTCVVYGGDGNDVLYTGRKNDTLIGGPGNDYLDGGTWGNDLYIYNKGDGLDYIVDTVGNDEIYLQGFDENDVFQIVVPTEREYVYYTAGTTGDSVCIQSDSRKGAAYSVITCNGEPIICVDKNRADNIQNALTLNVGGKKRDITSEIQPHIVHIYAHYEFSCPIDIDILDADGNVVYTVKDSQLGNFYNDYGNFYVLPNEDSPYNSKIIDLFEGYSIKIRGIGEGKMSLLVQDTDNYELLDACGANEVSITSNTTGTIEEDEETGIKYLLLDSDGDGDIDETIPLNPVHFEVEDHDSPMEYVPAQNATCVEDGVAAHYLCSCGRIFKDAEAKEEITDAAELVLPATGQHNYVKGKCTVCGQAQPRVPQTGDNTPLYAFCAMSMVTAAVLVVTLRRKKKA